MGKKPTKVEAALREITEAMAELAESGALDHDPWERDDPIDFTKPCDSAELCGRRACNAAGCVVDRVRYCRSILQDSKEK